jgi:hypothetical protein
LRKSYGVIHVFFCDHHLIFAASADKRAPCLF